MCKYGNCISLIDATYKTTLFSICVRTNVGHCTVAEFITANSIGEALDILNQSNPTWSPPVVLCDYSEAEILAIKGAFTSTLVYLCDFTESRLGLDGYPIVSMDSPNLMQRFSSHFFVNVLWQLAII